MSTADAIIGLGAALVVCSVVISIAMVEVARLRGLAIAAQALADIEKAKAQTRDNTDGEAHQ